VVVAVRVWAGRHSAAAGVTSADSPVPVVSG
jgi:hypothetical protein